MELTLGIPALLFPAISLTMLAYNARYLAIAALIRQLHQKYQETASQSVGLQVQKLRKRLTIIKNMQATAIFSFLLAVITMTLIYIELTFWANLGTIFQTSWKHFCSEKGGRDRDRDKECFNFLFRRRGLILIIDTFKKLQHIFF